ncbi:hypothetical protein Tco_1052150 [Tanacetum coccineum]
MENINPLPTLNSHVLPTALLAKVVQELHELQAMSTFIDSRLENSDDDSYDGEVLSEVEEYDFVAYFDPFLPMNITTQKAYDTIMVNGLESTRTNLVAVVRDVCVFVGSFTYVTDFVVLEDIGEYILREMAEVVMGKPFREVTKLNYDCAKGLMNAYEKNKFMYKNCLNLGPDYQIDENMKEWLIRGHELTNRIACRNIFQENECEVFTEAGDGVRIIPDGVRLYLMRRSLEVLREFPDDDSWITI